LNSYSEKTEHVFIFKEIGQVAEEMTYIQVQLPINITDICHQNEMIQFNLNRIMKTEFKSNIPQSLIKVIKTMIEFFLKQLYSKMENLEMWIKIFQMTEFFQNIALVTPCTNHPL
jgi:hypothetical protein